MRRNFIFFPLISLLILNNLYSIRRLKSLSLTAIKKEWVKKDFRIEDFNRGRYLRFLEEIKKHINPDEKEGVVAYYIGIGGSELYIDLLLPILTGHDIVIAVDKSRLNPKLFRKILSLSLPACLYPKEILFQQEQKFSFKFTFKGRQRKIIIYYEKDANEFIPPELENGFNTIISRWLVKPGIVKDAPWQKWIALMKDKGFLITSGSIKPYDKYADLFLPKEFWNKFKILLKEERVVDANRDMFFLIKD